MRVPNQRQQPPIPSAQVEDAPGALRNEFEQRRLSFATVRNRIRALQIVANVLVRCPKIDGFASHEGKV
jgi:hypothetical protein